MPCRPQREIQANTPPWPEDGPFDLAVIDSRCAVSDAARKAKLKARRTSWRQSSRRRAKEAHGEFESECPGYCGAQNNTGSLKQGGAHEAGLDPRCGAHQSGS